MVDEVTRRGFLKAGSVAVLGALVGCGGEGVAGLADGGAVDDLAAGDAAAGDGWVQDAAERDAVDGEADAAEVGGDVPTPDVDVEADAAEADLAPVEPEVFDPGALPWDASEYPLGIAAGEPRPGGALLWTQYAGEAPLEVVVFADDEDDAAPGVVAARVEAAPEDAGFTKVTVDGLATNTRYRYAFTAGGERSQVGWFRTAPALDALVPVTFGGSSCSKPLHRPYTALQHAAAADLAFFLLAGDTTYADGSVTREDYRAAWADSLTDVGYRALLRRTPVLATWDDHEVDNNWTEASVSPEQLAAARGAFFEHLPIARLPDAPDRIWRSHRWGATLEVFVLDGRGERKPETRGTAEAQYVSPEQLAWLMDGLAASPAVFKVVLNSVPFTNMSPLYPSGKDRWQGYPEQRGPLLAHMAEIPGVFWLSGDFHFGALAHLEPFGTGSAMWEVFMGHVAQIPNPAALLLDKLPGQFPFVTAEANTVRFTADPLATPPKLEVTFVSAKGAVLHTATLHA